MPVLWNFGCCHEIFRHRQLLLLRKDVALDVIDQHVLLFTLERQRLSPSWRREELHIRVSGRMVHSKHVVFCPSVVVARLLLHQPALSFLFLPVLLVLLSSRGGLFTLALLFLLLALPRDLL